MSTQRFASFHDFYPYYLREHSSRASRRLHVIGTSLAIVLLIVALATRTWSLLWAVPLAGYAVRLGRSLRLREEPAGHLPTPDLQPARGLHHAP